MRLALALFAALAVTIVSADREERLGLKIIKHQKCPWSADGDQALIEFANSTAAPLIAGSEPGVFTIG